MHLYLRFYSVLNTSVSPTGSFEWSFADNVSSIVSWPLGGHFDLASTEDKGVPNLQAGGLDITSTSGSATTFSTINPTASSTSESLSGSSTQTDFSSSSPASTTQSLGSTSTTNPAPTSLASGPPNAITNGTAASTVTAIQTIVALSPSSPSTHSSRSSAGAGAGIGAGVAVGALLVVAAAAALIRRYRRMQSERMFGQFCPWPRAKRQDNVVAPSEMSTDNSVKEMSADGQIRELPANGIHDKVTAQYR